VDDEDFSEDLAALGAVNSDSGTRERFVLRGSFAMTAALQTRHSAPTASDSKLSHMSLHLARQCAHRSWRMMWGQDVKHSLTRCETSSLPSTGDSDLQGRRLFLARCCFRGLLPSGPGSKRSLGLRLMLI